MSWAFAFQTFPKQIYVMFMFWIFFNVSTTSPHYISICISVIYN